MFHFPEHSFSESDNAWLHRHGPDWDELQRAASDAAQLKARHVLEFAQSPAALREEMAVADREVEAVEAELSNHKIIRAAGSALQASVRSLDTSLTRVADTRR